MHHIENIMQTSMTQIKNMVDVNTIVGSPIMTEGETMVLPVSKVSLGFLSGGGEYGAKSPVKQSGASMDSQQDGRYPFAGTAVAGMCLTPMAFLTVNSGDVKVLPVHYECTVDRVIEKVPQLLCSIRSMFKECCDNSNKQNGRQNSQNDETGNE